MPQKSNEEKKIKEIELQFYSDKANAQASFLIAIIFGTLSWLMISDQILKNSDLPIRILTIVPLGIFIALGIYVIERFSFYSKKVDERLSELRELMQNPSNDKKNDDNEKDTSAMNKEKSSVGRMLRQRKYFPFFYTILMGLASFLIYFEYNDLLIYWFITIILALLVNSSKFVRFLLILGLAKNGNNNDTSKEVKNLSNNENLFRELTFILYGAALTFSVNNAFMVGVFKPGDLFVYIKKLFFGIVESVNDTLLQTILFLITIFLNIIFLAFVLRRKYIERITNYYIRTILYSILGSTPMILYWLLMTIFKKV